MELNDALIEQLERYVNGHMNADEAELFEKEIRSNTALQEFLALYDTIDAYEDDTDWPEIAIDKEQLKAIAQKFRDPDTVAFAGKVRDFQKQHTSSSDSLRTRLIAYASVAACILLIVFLFWPSGTDLNAIYSDHSSWQELPSFTVKGDTPEEQKSAMERAFRSGEYGHAIALSDTIINNSVSIQPNVLIYKGIAQLELNRFKDAVKTFTALSNSDALDAHKGYWYTALVYAKQGNRDLFIEALRKVVSDSSHFKYEDAFRLLKKFE